MTTAYEEIMAILAHVEGENGFPSGTLKRIYDAEKSMIHLRVRSNMLDELQGIVSDAAMKMCNTEEGTNK